MNEQTQDATALEIGEFLQSVPPGQERRVVNLQFKGHSIIVVFPRLWLHCDNADCDGHRYFTHHIGSLYANRDKVVEEMIGFFCSNCRKHTKTYALRFTPALDSENDWLVVKYGEIPSFGPPLPSKLLTLLRKDSDLLSKGRRCENQGMGIGAFGYYRRLIENQKSQLFNELIRAVRKITPYDEDLISELELASNERKFAAAVERIHHALPDSLLVNGHSPLTLLHSALSEGLHEDSEEECLELASSIRLLLTDFSEKLTIALQKQEKLEAAVHKLVAKKGNKGSPSDATSI
ncbi:MAG: hypothetical protein AAF542_18110 [Pseudomonadota bacterium]